MTLQIELLESSFQAITPCGEAFVTAFYERLFTRFPLEQRVECVGSDARHKSARFTRRLGQKGSQ